MANDFLSESLSSRNSSILYLISLASSKKFIRTKKKFNNVTPNSTSASLNFTEELSLKVMTVLAVATKQVKSQRVTTVPLQVLETIYKAKLSVQTI
jgi:hypothetical protein